MTLQKKIAIHRVFYWTGAPMLVGCHLHSVFYCTRYSSCLGTCSIV